MTNLKDDIEKYHRGDMSAAEMHALEKRALSDPFLSEALEGVGHVAPDEFTADMADLHHSVRERIEGKPKKVIPLWTWPLRIAASLLLIAVATFVIVRLTDQKNDSLSLVEDKISERQNESNAAASDTLAPNEATEATKPAENAAAPSRRAPEPLAIEELKPSPAGKKEDLQEPIAMAEMEADAVEAAPKEVEDKTVITQEAFDNKITQAPPSDNTAQRDYAVDKDIRALESRKKAAAMPASETKTVMGIDARLIKGRVTSSENGDALPGVNVIVKGTNTGTVTDAQGNFQISAPTDATGLVLSFIGMQSKEVNVPHENGNELDVKMDPDFAQLSEVVVVGYGTQKTESATHETVEMAVPVGGHRAFKRYLEKSVRYPQQAIDNKVEGRVTVQFTVESSGNLSDFKIIKGLGYGCDEEVIRLIRQGPGWAPTKRNGSPINDKVKVRLKFTLPEDKE